MPKYDIVKKAAQHCWSNNFLGVFKDFFAKHAYVFKDAPAAADLGAEQNMEHYALFQEYLRLYEDTLSGYIESLDVSIEEFYEQLTDVKNDPEIKDKKLLHFVNYLLACTDYPAFYKVMSRAAKKLDHEDDDEPDSRAESKSESKYSESGSKGEGKASSPDRGSKSDYK